MLLFSSIILEGVFVTYVLFTRSHHRIKSLSYLITGVDACYISTAYTAFLNILYSANGLLVKKEFDFW